MYKGFEIVKSYNWKTNRKQHRIYYGKGNSKTTGFFDTKKELKAFVDWILISDYATICNKATESYKQKYLDLAGN